MIFTVALVLFVSKGFASVCTPDELIEYRTDCQKEQQEETSSCVQISFDEEQCSCLYEIDFACWKEEKACLKKTQKCRTLRFDSKTKQCLSEADRRCMILEAISLDWLLQLTKKTPSLITNEKFHFDVRFYCICFVFLHSVEIILKTNYL